MDDLTYALEPESGVPLYEQLYRFIARDITQGRLQGGIRLPSRRALSRHMGISEQTVNNALDLLKAEGFLRSESRRGCFVEELLPLAQTRSFPSSVRQKEVSEPVYDFSPQATDVQLFPAKTWSRLIRETLIMEPELLNKGDAKGEYSLRTALSSFLYQYRGVRCGADNLIIGSGVDHLIGTLGMLLERPTLVACEDPGYPEAARALERLGHIPLHLEMDEQGIKPSMLLQSGANLAYLTPAHQFPTGQSMPAARRTELLTWAEEGGERYLIEDDYDSEFRYASRPLPALQGMGGGERTVYIGTFSRSLAPGIRIAYMALPPGLKKRYDALGLRSGDSVSRFEQGAMARLVSEGHYTRHLRRACNVYRKRCQALYGQLAQIPGVSIKGHEAGLHFTIGIVGKSEEELIASADSMGIPLRGLSSYCRYAELPPALVMGFGGIRDDQVDDAATALRKAWKV